MGGASGVAAPVPPCSRLLLRPPRAAQGAPPPLPPPPGAPSAGGQVRLLIAAAGMRLVALRRVRVGGYSLPPDLPLGGYRCARPGGAWRGAAAAACLGSQCPA